MRLSARVDYALRAAVELAAAGDHPVTSVKLAETQQIPPRFLETILVQLRRSGLVRGRGGLEGGYRLTRPAEQISLADVIRAIDGPLLAVRGERPEHDGYEGSARFLQDVWIALRARERALLEQVTLADIATGELPESIQQLAENPIPVTVYLAGGEDHESVEEAVEEVLDALGLEVEQRLRPVRGSFFRRLTARTKATVTSREVANRIHKLERALEMQVPHGSTAVSNAAECAAIAKLIDALGNEKNALVQIGPLLLIKNDGLFVVYNLTQHQLAKIERNPELLADPSAALHRLQLVGESSLESRSDEEAAGS